MQFFVIKPLAYFFGVVILNDLSGIAFDKGRATGAAPAGAGQGAALAAPWPASKI
jgi:hypothetical protein